MVEVFRLKLIVSRLLAMAEESRINMCAVKNVVTTESYIYLGTILVSPLLKSILNVMLIPRYRSS